MAGDVLHCEGGAVAEAQAGAAAAEGGRYGGGGLGPAVELGDGVRVADGLSRVQEHGVALGLRQVGGGRVGKEG